MTIYLVKRSCFFLFFFFFYLVFFFSSGRCVQIHLLDHKMPSKCGYLDRLLLYRAVRPSLSTNFSKIFLWNLSWLIFGTNTCRSMWHQSTMMRHVSAKSTLGAVCAVCYRGRGLLSKFHYDERVSADSPAWKWNKPFFAVVTGVDTGKKLSDYFYEKEHFKLSLWLCAVLLSRENPKKSVFHLTYSLHSIQNVICLFKASIVTSPFLW